MREKEEHKEPLDDFSDYIRGRLEGHRSPVGEADWRALEARLERRSGWRRRLWAGVAAAILFVTVVWRIDRSMPELNSLTQLSQTGVILAAMIAGGVVISLLFTTFAVNKFVNMKSNKIHLY